MLIGLQRSLDKPRDTKPHCNRKVQVKKWDTCQEPIKSVFVKSMSDTANRQPQQTGSAVIIDTDEIRTCNSAGKSQAYSLRAIAYELAVKAATNQITDEDRARITSVKAMIDSWASCDEQVRVHTGRMKPGSINARDDSAAKGKSRRPIKSSPPAGPVVYPPPIAESAPSVVSDKGEKPSEDGPKEGV